MTAYGEGMYGEGPYGGTAGSELSLTVLTETATTITFAWTPVEGCGYRLSRSAGKGVYSVSWNAAKSTAKFSKDSDWYKVEALDVSITGKYVA